MPATALVSGGARRIGAAIARQLHQSGYNLVLHYHHSLTEAEQLANELNLQRADSVNLICADLVSEREVLQLCDEIQQQVAHLDLLVNNASVFQPAGLDEITSQHWQQTINTNLLAPLLLTRHLAPALTNAAGSVVNIVDIHADRPLKNYPVYSISKAGLAGLTRSLALELAPTVRVNGVSPGAILWPEHDSEMNEIEKASMLAGIPLERLGQPEDIAQAVVWLAQAKYVTGQVIAVDGGRNLVQG